MMMKKKLLSLTMAFTLLFLPVVAQAKGFSGGSSSRSYTTHASSSLGSKSYSTGGTYHSGYKAPSASVQSKQPSYNHRSVAPAPAPSKKSSFLTHAAAFGAGAFLGHMLHPFGTSVPGVGGTGFSLSGLLMDAILIMILVWIVRRIFARR
jgi:hypothetical protein